MVHILYKMTLGRRSVLYDKVNHMHTIIKAPSRMSLSQRKNGNTQKPQPQHVFPPLLTHKQLETPGHIQLLMPVLATDAMVLKHQANSIHSAEQISIALDPFGVKCREQR